jgi:hypothetical protein
LVFDVDYTDLFGHLLWAQHHALWSQVNLHLFVICGLLVSSEV